jgi:hypothetical protein
MKNLIQRLAPITLAVVGLVGCATYQTKPVDSFDYTSEELTNQTQSPVDTTSSIQNPEIDKSNMEDLRNGYFAENYITADIIDNLTGFMTLEVLPTRTDDGKYTWQQTSLYLTTNVKTWESNLTKMCNLADPDKDFIIQEEDAKTLLDMTYEVIFNPDNIDWVEE